jgi:transposase-like protein
MSNSITTAAPTTDEWDDPLMRTIRPVLREAIEAALEQELSALLGVTRYQRAISRGGYRNGTQVRALGTPLGQVAVAVPRARVQMADGATQEWRSRALPRYGRRLSMVDQAIVRVYLSGTNQRKIAAALRPLLTGVAMSKSAVSRLAGQLQVTREAWLSRRFDDESFVYLYLDGFVVPVRRDGRVVRAPLLIVVGVRATGKRVLLMMQLATGESTIGWRSVLDHLVSRGLRAPQLCILDGSAGLRAAIVSVWPTTVMQRCVVHKLRNLLAHAPHHSHAAVSVDFHRVVYAPSLPEAERAFARMQRHWQTRCAAVATSLAEGGPELLSFYRFPAAQWKSLRSTNVIERIHGELRRRIKSQTTWSTERGMLNLLHGLFAAGIIRLRRIDGFTTLPTQASDVTSNAA